MPGSSTPAVRARVLFCSASPHPVALKALGTWAPQAEVIDVTGDDMGYWREIRSRWTGETGLVLIEQDNEIREDTITSLESCDQDWCCFAYPIFARGIRLTAGLGCTKISAALQRKVPANAVEERLTQCEGCEGKGYWWHLDRHVAVCLKQAGFEPHVHGDIAHHHAYPLQSFLWPPPYIGASSAKELFGDDRPDRDIPPIGPFTIAESAQFATALLTLGVEAVEEQEQRGEVQGEENLPPSADGDNFLQIYQRYPYQTDKVAQGYLPAYLDIAADLGPAARVCELGVFGGGSLRMWQHLFPEGTVAGVDASPSMRWPDGTVKILIGQDDPELPNLLSEHEAEWDLIVDDASHDGTLTAAALKHLWPLVAPGGFYVIEDWFVGFGDYNGACKSPAMLTVAQGLLERLHAGTDTEWVSFRYGMAVIRKRRQSGPWQFPEEEPNRGGRPAG